MSEMHIDEVQKLPDMHRRALVFAQGYEEVRRRNGQWGYKVFPDGPKDTPNFKVFTTLSEWLDSKGWKVTWKLQHWQGYVEFCFKDMKPNFPQPGQLKNPILLKKYILSIPDKDEVKPKRNKDQLSALYKRIVLPQLSQHAGIMDSLGLRSVTNE